MELKHNKYDIVVYIMILILIISLLVVSSFINDKVNGDIRYAVVTIEGKQKFKLNMEDNTEIILDVEEYPSLLGEMIIEIKNNKVRVKKEESPFHYCSMQGWIEDVGKPIICLPNSVIVTIIGQELPNNDLEM